LIHFYKRFKLSLEKLNEVLHVCPIFKFSGDNVSVSNELVPMILTWSSNILRVNGSTVQRDSIDSPVEVKLFNKTVFLVNVKCRIGNGCLNFSFGNSFIYKLPLEVEVKLGVGEIVKACIELVEFGNKCITATALSITSSRVAEPMITMQVEFHQKRLSKYFNSTVICSAKPAVYPSTAKTTTITTEINPGINIKDVSPMNDYDAFAFLSIFLILQPQPVKLDQITQLKALQSQLKPTQFEEELDKFWNTCSSPEATLLQLLKLINNPTVINSHMTSSVHNYEKFQLIDGKLFLNDLKVKYSSEKRALPIQVDATNVVVLSPLKMDDQTLVGKDAVQVQICLWPDKSVERVVCVISILAQSTPADNQYISCNFSETVESYKNYDAHNDGQSITGLISGGESMELEPLLSDVNMNTEIITIEIEDSEKRDEKSAVRFNDISCDGERRQSLKRSDMNQNTKKVTKGRKRSRKRNMNQNTEIQTMKRRESEDRDESFSNFDNILCGRRNGYCGNTEVNLSDEIVTTKRKKAVNGQGSSNIDDTECCGAKQCLPGEQENIDECRKKDDTVTKTKSNLATNKTQHKSQRKTRKLLLTSGSSSTMIAPKLYLLKNETNEEDHRYEEHTRVEISVSLLLLVKMSSKEHQEKPKMKPNEAKTNPIEKPSPPVKIPPGVNVSPKIVPEEDEAKERLNILLSQKKPEVESSKKHQEKPKTKPEKAKSNPMKKPSPPVRKPPRVNVSPKIIPEEDEAKERLNILLSQKKPEVESSKKHQEKPKKKPKKAKINPMKEPSPRARIPPKIYTSQKNIPDICDGWYEWIAKKEWGKSNRQKKLRYAKKSYEDHMRKLTTFKPILKKPKIRSIPKNLFEKNLGSIRRKINRGSALRSRIF